MSNWDLHFYFNNMDEVKKELLEYFTVEEIKDKSVFDYGCGTGSFSFIFSELGSRQVIAVDISKNSIKEANNIKNKLKIKNINFYCLQQIDLIERLGDKKYDVIFSRAVLHYLEEPLEQSINKLKKILADNGIMYIAVLRKNIISIIVNNIKILFSKIPEKYYRLVINLLYYILYIPFMIFLKKTDEHFIKNKMITLFYPAKFLLTYNEIKKIITDANLKIIDEYYNIGSIKIFSNNIGFKLKK